MDQVLMQQVQQLRQQLEDDVKRTREAIDRLEPLAEDG